MLRIPKEPLDCMEPSTVAVSKSEILISHLSVEILLKIFKFLDNNCLWHNLSLVCKAWNKLAFDRSLWKRVSLTLKEGDYPGTSNIHHLIIRNDHIARILARIPYIQHLSIAHDHRRNWPLRDFSMLIHLQSLSLCCPNHRCELENCIILPSDFFPEKQENNFGLNQLKKLELVNVLSDAYLTVLLEECPNVQEISLKLEHNFCLCASVARMFEVIFSILADTLVDFELKGDISSRFLLGINQCSKLKKLIIFHCSTIKDPILFVNMKLSNLVELKLDCGTDFTAEMIDRMFDDGKLRNLITLELCIPEMQNFNLKTIANNCPNLQVFLIRSFNITDEGISFFIKKCSKITDFTLCRNHYLTTDSEMSPFLTEVVNRIKGSFLLDIRDNFEKLQRLRVSDIIYTSEYATLLRKARPDLNFSSCSFVCLSTYCECPYFFRKVFKKRN